VLRISRRTPISEDQHLTARFDRGDYELCRARNRLSVRVEERLFGFDAIVRDPVYAFYHHGGLVYLLHMDKTSWVEKATGTALV